MYPSFVADLEGLILENSFANNDEQLTNSRLHYHLTLRKSVLY